MPTDPNRLEPKPSQDNGSLSEDFESSRGCEGLHIYLYFINSVELIVPQLLHVYLRLHRSPHAILYYLFEK